MVRTRFIVMAAIAVVIGVLLWWGSAGDSRAPSQVSSPQDEERRNDRSAKPSLPNQPRLAPRTRADGKERPRGTRPQDRDPSVPQPAPPRPRGDRAGKRFIPDTTRAIRVELSQTVTACAADVDPKSVPDTARLFVSLDSTVDAEALQVTAARVWTQGFKNPDLVRCVERGAGALELVVPGEPDTERHRQTQPFTHEHMWAK